jgi:hypothetical protein
LRVVERKIENSTEGKVNTTLIFSYAILKKRFGGRFTFMNPMSQDMPAAF